MWTFWEYLDRHGRRTFSEWRLGLQKVERATLDEKMRMVEAFGPGASSLKGPIKGFRHLYKIRVMTPNRALRPILCKGPQDKDREYTLLKGAFEVGGNWEPYGAPADADAKRVEVVTDYRRRIKYEVPKP